jgi:hypothetical protein
MRTKERAEASPGGRDRAQEHRRLRRGFAYCLWVFLGLRVGLSVVALAGVGLLPDIHNAVGPPGWDPAPVTPGWHNLVTAWERFDGLWFLRIATAGYVDGDGSAAFFPLYPLLIRFLSPVLGGHPLAAAYLVSHLAALGSLAFVYFLTASEWNERMARRSVLYLAVFPTSLFLLAPYSESLYLLLALACLWGARRKLWAVAGLAGAAAAATRNLGMLLVVPLAVEAVHQWLEDRSGPRLIRSLAWSALVLAGAGAYFLYWQGSVRRLARAAPSAGELAARGLLPARHGDPGNPGGLPVRRPIPRRLPPGGLAYRRSCPSRRGVGGPPGPTSLHHVHVDQPAGSPLLHLSATPVHVGPPLPPADLPHPVGGRRLGAPPTRDP